MNLKKVAIIVGILAGLPAITGGIYAVVSNIVWKPAYASDQQINTLRWLQYDLKSAWAEYNQLRNIKHPNSRDIVRMQSLELQIDDIKAQIEAIRGR